MKTIAPIQDFDAESNITQLFGVSSVFYKENFGIPSHNGVDIGINADYKKGYGTKIIAPFDYDTCAIETDFPNKTRGNGIFLRKKIDTGYIECCLWHLADFCIKAGSSGKIGETVGLMGNTGAVFPKPSKEQPYNGTHLHYGIRFYDNNNILIPSSWNGYVNPLPYMLEKGEKIGTLAFLREDLFFGCSGDKVAVLQNILKLAGFFDDEETGFFGSKTFKAVQNIQNSLGISGTGYVGIKTRTLLNSIYC